MCLSKIGFGGEAIGGGPYRIRKPNKTEAIRAILFACERGVNWVDTAPVYGDGRSEKIIGEAIHKYKIKIKVATKCGLKRLSNNTIVRDSRPKSIFKEIDDSLKRLKISEVYLYQLHWPDPNVSILETWEAMCSLVKKGKVRKIGVCNFDISEIKDISKIHIPFSVQSKFNIVNSNSGRDIISFCRENKIRNIAYGVLHSGFISGKFKKERLDLGDWRLREESWYTPQYLDVIKFLTERLRKAVEKSNKTIPQLLINWSLSHTSINNIILGMRKINQIEENTNALDLKLSTFETKELENIVRLLKEK